MQESYFRKNITFNAIPSGYKNITGGVTVFKSGTRDRLFLPHVFRNLWGGTLNDNVSVDVGEPTTCIITGNTINLSYFKTLTIESTFSYGSSADRRYSSIYILPATFKRNDTNFSGCCLKNAGVNTAYSASKTTTIDISSINQQCYIMLTGSLYEKDSQPVETLYLKKIVLFP